MRLRLRPPRTALAMYACIGSSVAAALIFVAYLAGMAVGYLCTC